MNKARAAIIGIWFILVIALAGLAFAENMTVNYYSTGGKLLATIPGPGNVTLPNSSMDIHILSADENFKVEADSVYPTLQLNTTSREINISNQTYNDVFGESGKQYIVIDAYAFDLAPNLTSSYTVRFNFTNLSYNAVSALKIFKTGFNFATNQSNTTNATELSTTISNNLASATTDSFSGFFLAEDHCSNGLQDQDETGTDCGGAHCDACPTGGGGGAGGGGGGRSVLDVFTIYPTNETQFLTVKKNDRINVVFNGEANYMHVKDVSTNSILLWFDGTIYYHTIILGDSKIIGIRSLFANDIVVSLETIEDGKATIGIKLYEKPVRLFPLLTGSSPRYDGREEQEPESQAPAPTPTVPAITTTIPAPEQQPEPQAPVELKSPVNIWSIVLAIAIIIVLLGGIAVFRRKHLALDKPPAAIRTGLDRVISKTELPPTTTQPKPVLLNKPEEVTEIERKAAAKISEVKKKELEKYVYHALSECFREEPIRIVLEKKGWPKPVVDEVFAKIKRVDEHAEQVGLHKIEPESIVKARNSVRRLRQKKVSKEEIEHLLQRKGWSEEQIAKIFEKL